jgi:hypothetical protein
MLIQPTESAKFGTKTLASVFFLTVQTREGLGALY